MTSNADKKMELFLIALAHLEPEQLPDAQRAMINALQVGFSRLKQDQNELTRVMSSLATYAVLGRKQALPAAILNDLAYFMETYSNNNNAEAIAEEIRKTQPYNAMAASKKRRKP